MIPAFFTSEAVSSGHPDKMADQISDAILDACLAGDPHSKVACETLVTDGLIMLAGEISTQAQIDPRNIVRSTIRDIGYDDPAYGFDYASCGVAFSFHQQSPDIALGIEKGGAGDQGMMFGFAVDETKEFMPLPIVFAHKILAELAKRRKDKRLPYLGPDAKSQVTVEYKNSIPLRIPAVVVSTQHREDVALETLRNDVQAVIREIAPHGMVDANTRFFINPAGRFVIGGPRGDTGLTGRKIMVDSYGSMGRHGGGAFSGKDPSKVDRSGAYMARYIAKNIVAARLAKRCEVELAYAIGLEEPVSVAVQTFGTAVIPDLDLTKQVQKRLDLTPRGIIQALDLLRPIYRKTASGGHFGREDPDFTWEKIDPELFQNPL
jgi:S-adenosylmethionine synthetase